MPMNEIEKIKYSISYFDVDIMAIGRKDVYELYSDGQVVFRCYQAGSRKCVKKDETTTAAGTAFRLLCAKLLDCISTADRENQYVDDTSAELKIYRSFGRVDTMPRGYGNADKDVGSIVCEYLFHAAGMDI
jgi:hypothetical protein